MAKYLVQLGHTPRLAYQELVSFLNQRRVKFKVDRFRPELLRLDVNHALDLNELIDTLGGTVRVAELLWQTEETRLVDKVVNWMQKDKNRNNFGLVAVKMVSGGGKSIVRSEIGHTPTASRLLLSRGDVEIPVDKYSQAIKMELKKVGVSSRFLLAKEEFLTPLQIETQRVIELVLVPDKNQVDVYWTKVVTDSMAWQRRDRLRPEVDSRVGVLPPKTARMMVNLALSRPASKDQVILDPFCGSGTILSEAAVLGLSCFGSDLDPKGVERSEANLSWLKKNAGVDFEYKLRVADATQLDLTMFENKPVDAIVCESDLGPVDRSRENLETTIENLFGLYESSILSWGKILKPKGRIVIAIARHSHPASVKMIEKLIDSCEKSGYTLSLGPVYYSRPEAFVKRAILVLTKSI